MTKKQDEVKKQAKKSEEKNIKEVKKTTKKAPTKKATVKKVEKVEKEEIKEVSIENSTKETPIVKEEKKDENPVKSAIELLLIIIAIVIIIAFFPNTVIWNIVVLLLILTALIFVHEFGHFIIGKLCGVHIYEFALGMGPKVLGFKRKNDPTEYNLRALPIGGYCSLAGEEGEDDSNLPKDKFMCNKGKLKRVAILVAGVTMNFITAFILLFFISFIWGSNEQASYIGHIEADSPAAKAGMSVGDQIIECNGYKLSTWDKLSVITSLKSNDNSYEYVVRHKDGKEEKYKIVPDEYVVLEDETIKITEEHTLDDIIKEKNLNKDEVEVSKLIGIGAETEIKHGFMNALDYAYKKFGSLVSTLFLILGSLFTGKLGLDALSGPVGMYTVVNTVAAYGLSNILYLAAYLSINLGIINILPFPAFDGGRVLFIGIEAITGKKVDPKIEGYFHTIGFMLIMLLMLYITWHDIVTLFF